MDQVKEILKQAIKYRFWIAFGISLLFPIIAYAVGSGPIKDEAKKKTDEIKGAKKDVEQYANGVAINRQYKPLVDAKTTELNKDVLSSWKKLYAVQAPLLTWPEIVQDRFNTWGRTWPENQDASVVQRAIIEYVEAYPKFVTEVYKSFRPFDYVDGGGVVSAPPEEVLLRPAKFNLEKTPDLGKVWAAQERLWIQRTLLEVVGEVNHNAKDWSGAIIKEIKALEVGSSAAQDQVSLASGETLEEAPAITDPKAPPPPAAESSSPAESGPGNAMMGMYGSGGGSGGGKDPDGEAIFYLKPQNPNAQYKIMPVSLTVSVEQDHIQDFLVALENSPMAIQVKEFEMSKPSQRIVKPEKGEGPNFGYGGYGSGSMMGMMGMMPGMMGRRGGVTAFGGNSAMMNMYNAGSMRPPGGAMGYGASSSTTTKSGVDKRGTDKRKVRKEGASESEKVKNTHSTQDPYFNVVEVTVYGQARFYNPPPPEPPAEPSVAAEGAAPADAAKTDAAKTESMPEKGDAEPAKTDEAKKDEKPKDEAKTEGDAPKKAEEDAAKKAEMPDAAKKDEAPKADAPAAKEEPAAPKAGESAPTKEKDDSAAKDAEKKPETATPKK